MISIKHALIAALCLAALPAQAASMFWSPNVTAGGGASCNNGTYNWDADSGTAGAAHKCWATTTGGTTAAAAPGAGDVATFDANSGGGTITVTIDVTLDNMVWTGFTGTLDWSANNKNVTLSTATQVLTDGSGTHTVNMGNGTWTMTSSRTSSGLLNVANAGLTLNANSSIAKLTSTGACNGAQASLGLGAKTWNSLELTSSGGQCLLAITAANNTYGTLKLTGPVSVIFPTANTQTVSTDLILSGTAGNNVFIATSILGTRATIATPATNSGAFAAIRDINFTGNAPNFTSCFNLGNNNNVTCTAPIIGSGGGGGVMGN